MLSNYNKLLKAMLQTRQDWITAGNLASRCGISVRSVKSYIAGINGSFPGLITASKKGYGLDRNRANQLLVEDSSGKQMVPNERLLYILQKLLTCGDKNINIIELAEDDLYVSVETIRRDLHRVRERLAEFDIVLDLRGGFTIALSGSEQNKRKMLVNILYEEFSTNALTVPSIEKMFPAYDIPYIHKLVLESCKVFCLIVNGYSLFALILDIVISIDRIKNNFHIKAGNSINNFNDVEQAITKHIAEKLEDHYDITYSESELYELALILVSNLMQASTSTTKKEISKYTGEETSKIMEALKSRLEAYDFFDFNNESLILRFTIHINNLLLRLKNGYTRKNPLTEYLKKSCPFIFDCAISLSDIINQMTGYKVDEDEAAYIALHLGSLLSPQRFEPNKIYCTILFPNYYDYREKFLDNISRFFGDTLFIQAIAAETAELKNIRTDLIISTIEVPLSVDTESVLITPLLLEQDSNAIKQKIEHITHEKKRTLLREQLAQIASPDLFFTNKTFRDEEAAICFMSSVMIQEGYADENFTAEVLAREKSYSTAYANIAIPHSMTMNALKTGMSVLINKKPIPWNSTQVNIVLLFSVNRAHSRLFYDIFNNLAVLLLEPLVCDKIINCNSYEDFTKTIIESF